MRFIEVPYLEAVPYPTMFGPGSSKPMPRKFRRRNDCKRKVDMDKIVHVDTFKGLLEEDVQDETSPTPEPTAVELVELVFAADLKIVTLNFDVSCKALETGPTPPTNDGKFSKNGKYDTSAEFPMHDRILEITRKFDKKVRDKDSWN